MLQCHLGPLCPLKNSWLPYNSSQYEVRHSQVKCLIQAPQFPESTEVGVYWCVLYRAINEIVRTN